MTGWPIHSLVGCSSICYFSKFFLVVDFEFHSVVVWTYARYDLDLFVHVEGCSVHQYVVYSGEHFMYTGEECIFQCLGWNVLNRFVKSIWSSVSFKAIVSLLIFLSHYLSIAVSGVLKSPTIMVLLSMSFFMFVINWFIYLGALTFGA